MNKELSSLNKWFQANKLTVNLTKTKYILFGSQQKLRNTETGGIETQLSLNNGHYIGNDSRTNFLGLVLDENLTRNPHIISVSRKIAKCIGILYRCRRFLSLDILKNLYNSFIYPYISYRTLIWGSNYKSRIQPIYKLQKRALRVMTFSNFRTPSKPLFKRLEILNGFDLAKFQLCELAYRHSNSMLPDIFCNLFTSVDSVHNYNTRSKSNKCLFLPRQNLNCGKFGVKYAGATSWNELPTHIKTSSSHSIFKTQLKTHLLLQ